MCHKNKKKENKEEEEKKAGLLCKIKGRGDTKKITFIHSIIHSFIQLLKPIKRFAILLHQSHCKLLTLLMELARKQRTNKNKPHIFAFC